MAIKKEFACVVLQPCLKEDTAPLRGLALQQVKLKDAEERDAQRELTLHGLMTTFPSHTNEETPSQPSTSTIPVNALDVPLLQKQAQGSLEKMSRKKTGKGKGTTPNSSPSGDKDKGKKVPSQSNGVVYPSRPSLSNSGEFYDIAFKVMLVGDSGVGKTCLLVRFKDGAFLAGSFISTVGIDFRNKVLNIDGVRVKLQIWDTAGQERFRSVTHAYYRDAHALLLLYDVTNKSSFDNIQAWLTEIHEFAQQNVVIMLLGNKADATHDRVVKREEGEKLAKEFGVPFMETSAKTGLNVELAFTAVAKDLKHREIKEPNEPKFQLQEYVNKEMKGAGCCRS